MPRPPDPATIERLKAIVGDGGWTDDPGRAGAAPARVAQPLPRAARRCCCGPASAAGGGGTVVRICAEAEVGVVPQGGNTGLVGGQIPQPGRRRGAAVASAACAACARSIPSTTPSPSRRAAPWRPCRRRRPPPTGCSRSAWPPRAAARSAATCRPTPAACTCSATATRAIWCWGWRWSPPTATLWDGLRALRKDNTGYDLKHLFLGAEGTLGVITAAVLKLFPRHRQVETVFAAVPSVEAAVALLSPRARGHRRRRAGLRADLPRVALEFVTRHVPGTTDPLTAPSPWYVLFDLTCRRATGRGGAGRRALDGRPDRRRHPGRRRPPRRRRCGACARRSPSRRSPRAPASSTTSRCRCRASPPWSSGCTAAVAALVPGIRPVPFGHVGDGNLHFNFSQPRGRRPRRPSWPATTRCTGWSTTSPSRWAARSAPNTASAWPSARRSAATRARWRSR